MYQTVLIVGTGRLPLDVAKLLRKRAVSCSILEYGNHEMSTLARSCKRMDFPYQAVDKAGLTDILSRQTEHTLVISANNAYLFPAAVVEKENLTIINFHPALLPVHPGRNAEAWAIYEGDAQTGVTWHVVDTQVDHGNILTQGVIELDDTITSLQLMSQQFRLAAEQFDRIADGLLAETLRGQPMQAPENRKMHYSFDKPNGGLLNPDWPLCRISRFLRAMDYGPIAFLGEPRLLVDGLPYRWSRYQIAPNTENLVTDAAQGIFADDSCCIRLTGFAPAEDA